MESPPPPTKWLVPIGQSTATNIEFTGVLALTGGRGGIRTHGTLAGTPVFKTGALNHSATLPNANLMREGVADCKGRLVRAFMKADRPWAQPFLHHVRAHPISAAFALRYIHSLVRRWAVSRKSQRCAADI